MFLTAHSLFLPLPQGLLHSVVVNLTVSVLVNVDKSHFWGGELCKRVLAAAGFWSEGSFSVTKKQKDVS